MLRIPGRPISVLLDGYAWLYYRRGRIVQEMCRRNRYWRRFYKGPIRNVLFFFITGVYGGIGTCGKHRGRCGDPWEDQEVVLCFTYTPALTSSFDFSKKSRAELRARANE